jgi:thiamine-monophosphate kinase
MTSSSSEFDLIETYFAPLATDKGAFGLKDDAALLAPRRGCELVVTTDAVVAGVDFFASDPAAAIAQKALRVNLSDLAAKGAEPFGYLLTLMLPQEIGGAFVKEFARGLSDDQRRYGVSLLGGDMSATPGPLAVSITAFGHVPAGRMVGRSGAKPGDRVFVTGTIGDSGGGLALLKNPALSHSAETHDALVSRYRLPEPRVSLAPLLRGASAAIDVSDGLLADLGHVAKASGVRIVVEAGRIPRSPALRTLWGDSPDAIVRAATAGDDYEIAYTASGPAMDRSTPVSRIGTVEKGGGVILLDAQGREIAVPRKGFSHF